MPKVVNNAGSYGAASSNTNVSLPRMVQGTTMSTYPPLTHADWSITDTSADKAITDSIKDFRHTNINRPIKKIIVSNSLYYDLVNQKGECPPEEGTELNYIEAYGTKIYKDDSVGTVLIIPEGALSDVILGD